jgi:alpha-1,3-glucan synthase
MSLNKTSHWTLDFLQEWPTNFQFNIWGMNPDGVPDQTLIYGDIDGDFVLDRIPPSSLIKNVINITKAPPFPHAAWRLSVDDRNYSYSISPAGSAYLQIALFVLLSVLPLILAISVVYSFMTFFYGVKFNETGAQTKEKTFVPFISSQKGKRTSPKSSEMSKIAPRGDSTIGHTGTWEKDAGGKRRTVLIATMEYDIEDWAIKIKIGGLGVMAQLMGKSLGHQDLIWVVPCVGGIDYPIDTMAEPMFVEVMEKMYQINVQYHVLRNITYVLLDAPVFRQQSKNEPYPARMVS